MARKLVMIVGGLICFLLQSCVFPKFDLGGIIPNLCLLLTGIFGFMNGEKAGMITGFCLGLLTDIFYGNIIGLTALILTYIGFLNGKFFGIYFHEEIKLPIILILTSDFTYGILNYIFHYLIRGRLNFSYFFVHVVLPEVLYTMLIMIVVYPIILGLHLAFDKYYHKKEKSDA